MPASTNDPDNLNEFLDIFFNESQDRFDELNRFLVMLETDPYNEELLYSILRNAHSIKGSAGMFGFTNLNIVAHRLEDLMELVHQHPESVTQEVMDILFEGCDILQIAFQRIAGGDHSAAISPREQSYLARIDAHIRQEGSDPVSFDQDLLELLTLIDQEILDPAVLKKLSARLRPHLTRNEPGAESSPSALPPGESFFFGSCEITSALKGAWSALKAAKAEPLEESEVAQFLIHLNDIFEAGETLEDTEVKAAITDLRESVTLFIDLGLEFDELQTEYYRQALGALTPWITSPEAPGADSAATKDSGTEKTCILPSLPPEEEEEESTEAEERPQSTALDVSQARKTVRVEESKIDAFLDSVGEMIVLGEVFNHLQKRFESVESGQLQLMREFKTTNVAFSNHVFSLQNSLMDIRRVELRNITGSLSRLVRDTSQVLGKKIQFTISGEDSVIDKSLLDRINTCLVHIVRNSVDHGIESPQERQRTGKSEIATIQVTAENDGGFLLLRVEDDGQGLNAERLKKKAVEQRILTPEQAEALPAEEAYKIIFHPGLSTATTVTDISGRGVGLNAVQENIKAMSGTMEVKSQPGRGCSFFFRIPLSVMLSVLDGMVVALGREEFVIPVRHILENFKITRNRLTEAPGIGESVLLRDELFPVLRLGRIFNLDTNPPEEPVGILVTVESQKVCLIVDNVVDHQQVVIKPIEGLGRLPGIMGGCLLGDGSIGLVLDIEGLLKT